MSAESAFFACEIVAACGTAIVLIGLALEYGKDVFQVWKLFSKKKFHVAQVEFHTPLKGIGSALVVIGIIIELLGGFGVVATSMRLETANRRQSFS